MKPPPPLSVYHLRGAQPLEYSSRGVRERALACVAFDNSVAQAELAAIPLVQVNTAVLGSDEAPLELWCAEGKVSSGEFESGQYRYNNELLFGHVTLAESDFIAVKSESAESIPPLQQATNSAFRAIFNLLDQLGYPHMLRIWNYFPAINVESYELERYRQFNVGRQQAFVACGRSLTEDIPAACALGTAGGALVIYFIALRGKPLAIENPRQVSAYHYPADYGPSEPTFSRASLAQINGQEVLFISGTASIIGYRSVHIGDVLAQTKETLANIKAVVKEANKVATKNEYGLNSLSYKVYLRRPQDFEVVRNMLQEVVGSDVQATYLEADICRQDLLVEIEAIAGIPFETL